jgi:hypothetical protein
MPCGTCGGGQPAPQREFVYTSPKGEERVVYSETEAKIQVSVNGGGSYKVKKKD